MQSVASSSKPGRGHQFDLAPVAVLEVRDLGAARDLVPIAREHRPAIGVRVTGDPGEDVGRVDSEGGVVEPRAHAAVEHSGNHVGRLLEHDRGADGMTQQHDPLDGCLSDVAELSQQPAPTALGALEIGHPEREVMEHQGSTVSSWIASMRSPVCIDAPPRTNWRTRIAMPMQATADPMRRPISTRRYRSCPSAVTTMNVMTATSQQMAMRVWPPRAMTAWAMAWASMNSTLPAASSPTVR